MNKITEALSRLRALADGPKGGRADYVGTISSDDAHLLSVQLSQLLKLKQCVDDALPALHWVTGHLRHEAENCRRHADFAPIASTFDDAASELNAVVLANIGADFTASVTPQSETGPTPEERMTDAQIKHMVDRFLAWRLPDDFQPDCGISFEREHSHSAPWGRKFEPIGTNLFTASQAEAMIRYLVEGLP